MKKEIVFGFLGVMLVVLVLGSVFSEVVYAKVDSRGVAFADKSINDKFCEIGDCSTGRISGVSLSRVLTEYEIGSNVYRVFLFYEKVRASGVVTKSDFVFLSGLEVDSFNFIASNVFSSDLLFLGVNNSVKFSQVEAFRDEKKTKVNFKLLGGVLSLGENEFSNIVPSNESYIILDELGEVLECDFVTGSLGRDYVFSNTKVYVPSGSRVTFDKGIINIDAPDNATFERLPSVFDLEGFFSETKIEGQNIKLPNGRVLDSGALNYRAGEFYVKAGESATIDGVRVFGEEQTNVFFDGVEHSGDYVSLGSEKIIMSTDKNKNLFLKFDESSDYFNNPVQVGLKREDSLLEINRVGEFENYPEIRSDSAFEVRTGEMYFDKLESDRVYFYNQESMGQSQEMTIISGTNKVISVGGENNFYAHLTGTTSPSVKRIDYFRNFLEGNPDIQEEIYSAKSYFGKQTHKQAVYLTEAQTILKEKMLSKYPEFQGAIDEFENKGNLDLIEQSASSKYNKYYLTPQEIKETLSGTLYENYWEVLDAHRDLHISFGTKGSVEKAKDVSHENFGLRQAFFKY